MSEDKITYHLCKLLEFTIDKDYHDNLPDISSFYEAEPIETKIIVTQDASNLPPIYTNRDEKTIRFGLYGVFEQKQKAANVLYLNEIERKTMLVNEDYFQKAIDIADYLDRKGIDKSVYKMIIKLFDW